MTTYQKYYRDKCKCGSFKSKKARLCLKCHHQKIKSNRAKWQDYCECGNYKSKDAKRCQRCHIINGVIK